CDIIHTFGGGNVIALPVRAEVQRGGDRTVSGDARRARRDNSVPADPVRGRGNVFGPVADALESIPPVQDAAGGNVVFDGQEVGELVPIGQVDEERKNEAIRHAPERAAIDPVSAASFEYRDEALDMVR